MDSRRAYFRSPMSTDGFMESQLNLHDAAGATVPGYGWVFPMGDGTVNIGVGVLSTFHRWKDLNTSTLMEAMVASAPPHWQVTAESQVDEARGGKLPMSFSVGPLVGRNWLLVGDAAGAINPFNGEGIAYAYETGRIAARHIGAALGSEDPARLWGYHDEIHDTYDLYFRVARAFVAAIGRPGVMKVLTRTGLRNRTIMEWTLRDVQPDALRRATYRRDRIRNDRNPREDGPGTLSRHQASGIRHSGVIAVAKGDGVPILDTCPRIGIPFGKGSPLFSTQGPIGTGWL